MYHTTLDGEEFFLLKIDIKYKILPFVCNIPLTGYVYLNQNFFFFDNWATMSKLSTYISFATVNPLRLISPTDRNAQIPHLGRPVASSVIKHRIK